MYKDQSDYEIINVDSNMNYNPQDTDLKPSKTEIDSNKDEE